MGDMASRWGRESNLQDAMISFQNSKANLWKSDNSVSKILSFENILADLSKMIRSMQVGFFKLLKHV